MASYWEPLVPPRAEMNEPVTLCVADEYGGSGDNNLFNFITSRASSNGNDCTAAALFAASQRQPEHVSVISPVLEQGELRGLVTSPHNSREGQAVSESGRWYIYTNGSRSPSRDAAGNNLVVTPVGCVAGFCGSARAEDIMMVDDPPVSEATTHSRVTTWPPLRQAAGVRIIECDSYEADNKKSPAGDESNYNSSKTVGGSVATSGNMATRPPGRSTKAPNAREANRLAVRKHRALKRDALQAQKEECDRLMELLAHTNKELNQLRHGVPALNLEERKELEQLRAFRTRIIEAVNTDSTVDRANEQ